MAGERAMYTGVENILDAFESNRNNKPYFSLWAGRTLLYQYNEDDLDKGFEKFKELMLVLEQNNDTAIYTLKFHPGLDKLGYITDKSPVIGAMPIRAVALQSNSGNGQQIAGYVEERLPQPVYRMMQSLELALTNFTEKQAALEAKVLALETGEKEEPDTLGRIAGLLNNPGVMDLIGRAIPVITNYFTPQPNIQVSGLNESAATSPIVPTHEPVTPAVTGGNQEQDLFLSDEQNDLLDSHLDRLSHHCDVVTDIGLLADLAEKQPAMFKMLLTNLKSL